MSPMIDVGYPRDLPSEGPTATTVNPTNWISRGPMINLDGTMRRMRREGRR